MTQMGLLVRIQLPDGAKEIVAYEALKSLIEERWPESRVDLAYSVPSPTVVNWDVHLGINWSELCLEESHPKSDPRS